MSAILMHGKPVAEQIEARVREGVRRFVEKHKATPTLAIVEAGKDPASQRYMARKVEACERVGMKANLHQYEADISGAALKKEVAKLSASPHVHGMLIQLPLPQHIEEPPHPGDVDKFDLFDNVAPEKDVDGLCRHTLAELYRGQQDRLRFLPCTALAIRRMLAFYKIETKGKRAVVVGRNDITAKPVVLMLGGRMCDAAAIWIHKHVPEAEQRALIRDADILVTAVGRASYRITADMVKPGMVSIDVATRVTEDGKLVGDTDWKGLQEVAGAVTPVPGGVGPVTVAAMLENLLRAAEYAAGDGRFGYTF